MKPREKKPEIVYRIIDRQTGVAQGSYSRACCDEFDFESAEEARQFLSNKYQIAKYKVTYELLIKDC